jgi:hypothetical protein
MELPVEQFREGHGALAHEVVAADLRFFIMCRDGARVSRRRASRVAALAWL